jgi:type II secretory pathway component PulM
LGRSGGFQHFVLSARNEGAIKVAELEENEKKALLAAGVVLGIVGTFAALVKAAMDQAAQSDGS